VPNFLSQNQPCILTDALDVIVEFEKSCRIFSYVIALPLRADEIVK